MPLQTRAYQVLAVRDIISPRKRAGSTESTKMNDVAPALGDVFDSAFSSLQGLTVVRLQYLLESRHQLHGLVLRKLDL